MTEELSMERRPQSRPEMNFRCLNKEKAKEYNYTLNWSRVNELSTPDTYFKTFPKSQQKHWEDSSRILPELKNRTIDNISTLDSYNIKWRTVQFKHLSIPEIWQGIEKPMPVVKHKKDMLLLSQWNGSLS